MRSYMRSCFARILILVLTPPAIDGSKPRDTYSQLFVSDSSEFTQEEAKVNGSLPEYLNGKYIHNGCGSFEFNNRSFSHTFDCYGKLHMWEFTDGNVVFSSRMLTSNFYNESARRNIVFPEVFFGVESPRFDLKERMEAIMNSKPGPKGADNMNVNLWDFGFEDDTILALTDSFNYLKINTNTLQATPFVFDNMDFSENGSMSPAHPQRVPDGSGSTISCVLKTTNMMTNNGRITLFRQEKGATQLQSFFTTEVPIAHYVHSFSITENYVVVALYPTYMREMCVTGSLRNNWRGVEECFTWDGKLNKTTLLVVSHKTGEQVTTSDVPPFFSFHHINAYEDSKGQIVVDLISNIDSSIIQSEVFASKTMLDWEARDAFKKEYSPSTYTRITIDHGTEESQMQEVSILGTDGRKYHFDFPIVNPKVAARKHCFVYGIAGPFAGDSKSYNATAIVKVDLCSKASNTSVDVAPTELYFPPANQVSTGDFSFVPNPASDAAEDDGVLLGVWINGNARGASYLRVLDAKTLKELATVETPGAHFHMPFGFHGQWFG
eukprot:jgi/Bigna1/139587/aug1.51_g14295